MPHLLHVCLGRGQSEGGPCTKLQCMQSRARRSKRCSQWMVDSGWRGWVYSHGLCTHACTCADHLLTCSRLHRPLAAHALADD